MKNQKGIKFLDASFNQVTDLEIKTLNLNLNLVQPAGGDPEEHVSQVVRAGDDQLQPQQPHTDLQICLHAPL